MTHQTTRRSTVAEVGGKQLRDHHVMHKVPSYARHSDQRSPSDGDAHGSAHHTGEHGDGHATSEEVSDEDDDEDSSGAKEDDQDDEDDDEEAVAPSHGLGKGKGLRPAIRIEPAGDDDSLSEEETASREAGHKTSKHPVVDMLNTNKKRTFSNMSSTSVLFGETDSRLLDFPRPKMLRKLSFDGGKGLLTYQNTTDHGEENAIESSNDEEPTAAEDDDYSGVMDIPDDDTDPERMEQQEEHFIINEEEQHATDLFSSSFDLDRGIYGHEDLVTFSLPDTHIIDFDFTSTADPAFGQFFEAEQLPSSPEPLAKRKFSDSSTKRVRFDDEVQVSDSSSSSSELDSATFPDLFMEQEKLPASIYQQLLQEDNDSDNADFPSDGSDKSYWDVGQDEPRSLATIQTDEPDESDLSGYETDLGDTTDEYDTDFGDDGPSNPRTPRQKTVLRRPASAPGSKAPSPSPFQRGNLVPPPRGVFIHDESRKAIAVTDRVTKTLTFYRPRASMFRATAYGTYSSTSSTTNNSPRTSVVQMNASDSEISNEIFSNAFMGSDIMFTGVFGSAPSDSLMLAGESIGPPEAFYPFVSIENGNIVSDEDEYDDDEEYEDDLNLADFMDFGPEADETDVDQDEETDVPATPATSLVALNGSTPAQCTPTPLAETPVNRRRNASDAMLEHFDRAGVTAFRNNQNRYRDIARLPHDPHARASVSRPIRSGKSAETLMSPLRKRSSISKKHGSSPFAGVTKATNRLQSSVNQRGPPMRTLS